MMTLFVLLFKLGCTHCSELELKCGFQTRGPTISALIDRGPVTGLAHKGILLEQISKGFL